MKIWRQVRVAASSKRKGPANCPDLIVQPIVTPQLAAAVMAVMAAVMTAMGLRTRRNNGPGKNDHGDNAEHQIAKLHW